MAESFDAVVKQADADVLILFYSPSCPHCKKLEPVYSELARKVAPSRPSPCAAAADRLTLSVPSC